MDLSFARLRLLDQPGDVRQLRVRSDRGCPDHKASGRVYGAADDGVAWGYLHRHGLAGNQGGIDRRVTRHHFPVGCDLLASPDDELVADAEEADRQAFFDPVTQQGHLLGPKLKQGAQRGASLVL